MKNNFLKLPNGATISPEEVIKRMRKNMLIHSYLYYWMDEPVISDDKWQEIANNLRDIQKEYPQDIGFYDEVFKDWNGDTGMHLPKDEWVVCEALYLLRMLDALKKENKGDKTNEL